MANGLEDFLYDDRDDLIEERRQRIANPDTGVQPGTRGNLLPIARTKEGKPTFAIPQWARNLWNSVTLPGDVAKGYTPTPEENIGFALDVGLGGVSSSMIAGQAADPNTLGMFLGKRAKGANTRKLAEAMSLKDQGVSPEEIWTRTGWFEGLDDQWKWELPDNNMDINRAGLQEAFDFQKSKGYNSFTAPPEETGKAIQHSDLFNQYPDTSNLPPPIDKPYVDPKTGKEVIPTTIFSLKTNDGLSEYAGGYTGGHVQEIFSEGTDLETVRWVIAHELQHAVQEREGFEPGSNLTQAADWATQFSKHIPKEVLRYIGSNNKISLLENEILETRQVIESLEKKAPKGWSLFGNGISDDMLLDDAINLEDSRDFLKLLERQLEIQKDILSVEEMDIKDILPEVKQVEGFLNRKPIENYRRNAGEAEARLVQTRLDRPLEENASKYPLSELDVPREEIWTLKSLQALQKKFEDWEQDSFEREINKIIGKESEAGYEEGMNEALDDNTRRYAKGGMVIDPVSGNEVPAGARPEEVRDDIDIKASEGEYIIPARVVRFLGLDKIEKMCQKAEEALDAMEATGRIGGEEKDKTEELPFDIGTLNSIEEGGKPTFAEGGLVENTGTLPQNNGFTGTKQYKDANGNVIFIPWVDGAPLFQPPQDYVEDNPQAVTAKAPNPMANVNTGRGPLTDNDPSKNERTQGASPLAGSPTKWSVDNFLDYTKQKHDPGAKAIKGIISMMPGGGLAMKVRDKFLDPQVTQLFDTMIETNVDPLGNQITPEQRSQLIESRNQLKDQMSKSSGLNLNPLERLSDAFNVFARFTNPQAHASGGGGGGAPVSSLSPEATRMVTPQNNNKSDNQYSGGNVSIGSDLGKKNNGPTNDSMRSGGLYKDGGLVARRKPR